MIANLNKVSIDGINSIEDWYNIFIVPRYYSKQGIYHNAENHITPMLNAIESEFLSEFELQVMILFVIFHDCIHDVFHPEHDIDASISELYAQSPAPQKVNDAAAKLIRCTDYKWEHMNSLSPLQRVAISLDLYSLINQPIDRVERVMWREYQHVELQTYKTERIKVLQRISAISGIDLLSQQRFDWIKSFAPNVGVFAGSFNPFHIGHLNVVQQAEKIFDKVIVAVGQNDSKPIHDISNGPRVANQVDYYGGLLTDYIKSKPYPVTLIRGLRNISDLQYEINLRSTLCDLDPTIIVVYIVCDSEFSHVSSSMVRELEKHGKGKNFLV